MVSICSLRSTPGMVRWISAPRSSSSSRFPCTGGSFSDDASTSTDFRPATTAAAAVARAWLDWAAPAVINVVAPLASASPTRNSSLRTLLPPKARPVRSSRLMRMRGLFDGPPRESRSLLASCNGVGRFARGKRGTRVRSRDTNYLLLFNRIKAKDLSRYLYMSQVQAGVLERMEHGMALWERFCALPE